MVASIVIIGVLTVCNVPESAAAYDIERDKVMIIQADTETLRNGLLVFLEKNPSFKIELDAPSKGIMCS